MKSAYERALEKLEEAGIERPDEGSLSERQRNEIQELRQKHQAKLAELEILHAKSSAGPSSGDPAERQREDDNYRSERQRLEDRLQRELDRIRQGER